MNPDKPNVVFVFADQWRGQATGYAGDPNAKTPHLDRLTEESLMFTQAVSGCPVCTPYRASLITGQYWLTHGLFMNDLCLGTDAVSIADAFNGAGYDTGYIGKWHLDGHGRSSFIPRERRQGFEFWKVLECTHNYNNSVYYGDTPEQQTWDGYDAIAQTHEAIRYLSDHPKDKPFALFLSWGPPHAPYGTAPEEYRRRIPPEDVVLQPSVPKEHETAAREELAGYYAHIAALDDCIGLLDKAIDELGIRNNTVFVFTSDHGDMLHSHGYVKKQQPYAESLMVPLIVRYPDGLGNDGREVDTIVNSPDLMPTLLGLCGLTIPETVEGRDFAPALLQGDTPQVEGALIMCAAPFGQWTPEVGGREYRGVYTGKYTYTRALDGPWELFDNEADPYQMTNCCNHPDYAEEQANLEALLTRLLQETNDEFLPAEDLIAKWGYEVDETGTIPYSP